MSTAYRFPARETLTACQPLLHAAEQFCIKHSLEKYFKGGVTVALSGGADSVFLLLFSFYFAKEKGFDLRAVHVNHCIRGTESDRDEQFCRELCAENKIPIIVYRRNVPQTAAEYGETLEVAARRARYECFAECLQEYCTTCIVTAHTATDNLETVLFRMARGTGLRGLAGIPVTRDRIVRPLLSQNAGDIRRALASDGVPFVIDSTNADPVYTRNYIRQSVLPVFLQIHGGSEASVTRMCRRIAADEQFITDEVNRFYDAHFTDGRLPRADVENLPEALQIRVLERLYTEAGGISGCEDVHLSAARSLIQSVMTNGAVDFPDALRLTVTTEYLFFSQKGDEAEKKKIENPVMYQPLIPGETINIDEIGTLTLEKSAISCVPPKNNSYFSISIPEENVSGRLYLRFRQDGDSYRYRGMTRRLKKLFADAKMIQAKRARWPIICDDRGILWVPGFGVRDSSTSEHNKQTTPYLNFKMTQFTDRQTDGGNNEQKHSEDTD